MKKLLIFGLMVICITLIPVSAYATTRTYNVSTTKKIVVKEGYKAKLTLPTKYKNIKWTSNNKKVATVSKYGTLSAVNGGTVTITASSGKKSFKCFVKVEEDYSEWVLYDTDDLELLAKNIIDGNVKKIDGEYYCSPEYYEMISNSEIVYENDISEGDHETWDMLSPDGEYIIVD